MKKALNKQETIKEGPLNTDAEPPGIFDVCFQASLNLKMIFVDQTFDYHLPHTTSFNTGHLNMKQLVPNHCFFSDVYQKNVFDVLSPQNGDVFSTTNGCFFHSKKAAGVGAAKSYP